MLDFNFCALSSYSSMGYKVLFFNLSFSLLSILFTRESTLPSNVLLYISFNRGIILLPGLHLLVADFLSLYIRIKFDSNICYALRFIADRTSLAAVLLYSSFGSIVRFAILYNDLRWCDYRIFEKVIN